MCVLCCAVLSCCGEAGRSSCCCSRPPVKLINPVQPAHDPPAAANTCCPAATRLPSGARRCGARWAGSRAAHGMVLTRAMDWWIQQSARGAAQPCTAARARAGQCSHTGLTRGQRAVCPSGAGGSTWMTGKPRAAPVERLWRHAEPLRCTPPPLAQVPRTWIKGKPRATDHSWEKMFDAHLHWKRWTQERMVSARGRGGRGWQA